MRHLDDSLLRRLHDEPEALDANDRVHVETCVACSKRAESIAADAGYAAAALRMDDRVDTPAAYARFTRLELLPRRFRFGLPLGICAAATLVLAFITTPLGTYASGMLAIFRPTQFAPINVSSSDLKSMQQAASLNAYGSFHETTARKRIAVTREQAAKATGYTIRIPHDVPAAVGSVPTLLSVQPGGTLTFTFDSKKARAMKASVAVPKRLDGSSVVIISHPLVMKVYGYRSHDVSAAGKRASLNGPKMTYVEMAIPEVRSKGATLAELESFILSQPQISPEVKAQFEAITDPSHTLPVPVQIDKRTATTVLVDGVSGLAIGDNTGVGAGIMWQKNGMLYIVSGGFKLDELVAVANSLR